MGSFSELIKNFDKTRSYVRDFFIYGYKVRSDFSVKSSRTYDDEKRRVESWLGDYISYSTSERGKQTCISVDSSHIAENPLYNAYYSKSFTANDIRYLIVPTSEARIKLIRQILKLPNNLFLDTTEVLLQKNILISKILVLQEIEKDW